MKKKKEKKGKRKKKDVFYTGKILSHSYDSHYFIFCLQYLERRFSAGIRTVGCVFFILEYVSIYTT